MIYIWQLYHHLENQNDGRNPGIVFVFPFWQLISCQISASVADSNTIVTATSILGVQQLDQFKGVQKFKMASCQPEVRISQLVDEIECDFKGYLVDILSGSGDICIWSLEAAILDFLLPVRSHSLPTSSSGLLESQHLAVVAVAVGVPYISSLGAELFAFEVIRPPSWNIHFRFGCTVSELVPLECWTPKTWG